MKKQSFIISTLERNSLVTLFTDPIRMVTLSAAMYFMIPYLYANGLTEVHFGTAQSIGNTLGFFMGLVAPAITNTLGRKSTTLIFLDIPFLIALLSLVLGGNYFSIIIFAICGLAFPKIGKTAYLLLMTENERQENKAFILGSVIAIPMAAGLIYPLLGNYISSKEINTALRSIYILFTALYIINFAFRICFYRETEQGKKIQQKPMNGSLQKAFKAYLREVPVILKNKKYILLTLLDFLNYAIMNMSIVISTYVLNKNLVTQVQYSRLAIGVAILNLIGNFIIIPKLIKRKVSEISFFIAQAAIALISLLSFMFVKQGAFVFLFIIYTIYGGTSFFIFTLNDSIILNNIPKEEVSNIYGATQILGSLLIIPIPVLYSYLLSVNLNLALISCCGVWMLLIMITCILRRC